MKDFSIIITGMPIFHTSTQKKRPAAWAVGRFVLLDVVPFAAGSSYI